MARHKNDIERYLNGEMTPAEMHALEREALNDPFLAEALEGIDNAGTDSFLFDLKQLNKSVRQRASLRKPKMISMWNWSIGIAAGLILLALSSVYIISLINNDPKQREMMASAKKSDSIETTKPLASEPTPSKDSIESTSVTAGKDENKNLIASNSTAEKKSKAVHSVVKKPETTQAASGQGQVTEAEEQPAERAEPQAEVADAKPIIAPEENAGAAKSAVAKRDEVIAQDDRAEVSKKRAAAPLSISRAKEAARITKGKVIAAEDNQPLPGVNVVIKGTSLGTVTDAEGNFEILLPEGNETLVLSFIGLQPTELSANSSEPVTVKMQNDLAQLSEVVVTGYAATKDDAPEFDTFEMAQPSGGRKAFKQYLEAQIQYPVQALENKVEGKVTIEFFVDVTGKVHDFKIVKGIGYGCDEEVIRAVKTGPAWSPSKKNSEPRQEKVRVRYRFSLLRKR